MASGRLESIRGNTRFKKSPSYLQAVGVPCSTNKGDRRSQQISFQTVKPSVISVCRLVISSELDRWPLIFHTRIRWSSTLRERRNSSLKITFVQWDIFQFRYPHEYIQHCLCQGVSGTCLNRCRDLSPLSEIRLRVVSLDTKEFVLNGKYRWIDDIVNFGVDGECCPYCLIISCICGPGTTLGTAAADCAFYDPLLPRPRNYHIALTNMLADTFGWPTHFPETCDATPFAVGQMFIAPWSTS